MSEEITESIARRVLEVVDAGLVQGVGEPVPGEMCVEAAVCYALGLPHGDEPPCVAPAARRLTIRLNDACWSSPQARANGLRRLAIASLGSAGALDEREFARRVVRLAIQTCVPTALRAAAQHRAGARQARLLSAATACERDPSRENALEARAAATDAAGFFATAAAAATAVYAADAATAADYAAATDAAGFFATAAAAATDAARAAAYAAAATADYAAAYVAGAADYAAAADAHLSDFAERVVQVLIDLGAPGRAFLYLTDEQEVPRHERLSPSPD